MLGGSVYKEHTFNRETAQYIAQIFSEQYNYMNITTLFILGLLKAVSNRPDYISSSGKAHPGY
jgi:predicted secreted Zn-dependent protease